MSIEDWIKINEQPRWEEYMANGQVRNRKCIDVVRLKRVAFGDLLYRRDAMPDECRRLPHTRIRCVLYSKRKYTKRYG